MKLINTIFKRGYCYAVLLLMLGCSVEAEVEVPEHIRNLENLIVYSADTEPDSSIELVHEVTLEVPDSISRNWYGNYIPHSLWLSGIEITESGKIFMGDSRSFGIHMFDIDGSYLRSLGRKGYGPGEYGGIGNMQIVSDSLVVFDYVRAKMVKYSLESLEFTEVAGVGADPVNLDEFEELSGWFSSYRMLRHDGTLLVGFMEHPTDARKGAPTYNLNQVRPIKHYFMNQEKKIISDELFELKDREDLVADVDGKHLFNLAPFPFLDRPLIAISDDDYTYTNWTENFLIKVYDPNGNYLHAFYYPFQNKPLRRDEVTSLFNKDDGWNWDLVQHADLPETWPAINLMRADDKNRLWISTNIDKEGVYEWWILQPDGELVARFQWPDNLIVETVKNGYVYALETDEETQLQQVKRYRIEME